MRRDRVATEFRGEVPGGCGASTLSGLRLDKTRHGGLPVKGGRPQGRPGCRVQSGLFDPACRHVVPNREVCVTGVALVSVLAGAGRLTSSL